MHYESNYKALQLVNPQFAKLLDEVDASSIEVAEMNGTAVFLRTDDNGSPYYSASVVDPQYEADIFLQSINLDNRGYVLLGVPSLTFIEKILESTINSALLVIIEKDLRVIKRLLELLRPEKWRTEQVLRLFFMSGDVLDVSMEVKSILDSYEGIFFYRPEVVRTYPTYRTDEAYFRQIHKAVYEQVRNKSQLNGNQIHSTLKGIRQEIDNVPQIVKCPRLKDLKNRYLGKPIICVASGPSLDKQLPMLKELQGKVLILCAVSAFRVLIQNGIEPDIVSVLERGPEAIDKCFNDTPIPKKTWLFILTLCDPRLFTFWPNPVVPCFKQNTNINLFMNDALGGMGTLQVAHSVAHMNFMLAHHLGANPIVLIGQDLAYHDTGRTHSVHTHYEAEAKEAEQQPKKQTAPVSYLEEEIYVNGYYGGRVRSKRLWQTFLSSFETMSLTVDVPVINATEGGADIVGTIKQPFREVFETYKNETVQPLDTFKEELYANVTASDKKIHDAYKKFLVMNEEMRELLDDMENYWKTIIEFGKTLLEYEPEEERFLLRKARSHSLYFEILLEKLRSQFYMGAYFRPIIAMHAVQTNPISRITNMDRVQELFAAYSNFCEVIVRAGRILIQTIEQKFNEILPPMEEDVVGDIDEMIAESVASLEAYVPNLVNACDQLVVYLQTGNPDWKVLFGEFTNGLYWVINVVDLLKQNAVPSVAGIDLNQLQTHFAECERYLKFRDFVSFADCIGYAIKPLLQSYQNELVKGVLH